MDEKWTLTQEVFDVLKDSEIAITRQSHGNLILRVDIASKEKLEELGKVLGTDHYKLLMGVH